MPEAPRRNFSTRATADTPKQAEPDAATKERDEREYAVETVNATRILRDAIAYIIPEYMMERKINSKNIITFTIADSIYTMLLDSFVNKKIDTNPYLDLNTRREVGKIISVVIIGAGFATIQGRKYNIVNELIKVAATDVISLQSERLF